MEMILFAILVLLLIGSAPVWPHSRNWGVFPSSGLGIALLILLIYLIYKGI